jgi:hypothetical protein
MKATMTIACLGLSLAACSSGDQASSGLRDDNSHLNVPANHCEVYIEKIRATESSHASGGMSVIVRVPYLGNGEFVQSVGFYGHTAATDLGNAADCHGGPTYNDPVDRIYTAGGADNTQLGEYSFSFQMFSGSVVNSCPGYEYAWKGSFFVQTNYKTYWVNPSMDPNQVFTFDERLWSSIDHDHGIFNDVSTNMDPLRTYNPLACTR